MRPSVAFLQPPAFQPAPQVPSNFLTETATDYKKQVKQNPVTGMISGAAGPPPPPRTGGIMSGVLGVGGVKGKGGSGEGRGQEFRPRATHYYEAIRPFFMTQTVLSLSLSFF